MTSESCLTLADVLEPRSGGRIGVAVVSDLFHALLDAGILGRVSLELVTDFVSLTILYEL